MDYINKYYMYICSENNGADQVRGDPAADLRLCFRIHSMQTPDFFLLRLM